MGRKEPDKKNPWGDKNQPPDLDEAIKKLFAKFKRPSGKKSKTPRGSDGGDSAPPPKYLVGLMLGVIIILWALSGIFIVDPAERAVVLRFGKYVKTVGPGPHWIARFISSKVILNVDRVSDYSYSAQMLTKDENLVAVSVVVQYRIGDLEQYLFNVSDPQESLQQATSSALRQVLGKTNLDAIITEGREVWGRELYDSLISILGSYKTGIIIVNVSPQPARAPENVQDAFDDTIKAQEDEKRFIEQARAYEAKVMPIADGNAKRIMAEAQAFARQVVLKAKGDTAEFLNLLPEYTKAPLVTGQRMYLDAMEQVLTNSSKIFIDSKSNNLMYLPLDKLSSLKPSVSKPKTDTDTDILNSSEVQKTLNGREYSRSTKRLDRSQ